jgi:hypothetical protein
MNPMFKLEPSDASLAYDGAPAAARAKIRGARKDR